MNHEVHSLYLFTPYSWQEIKSMWDLCWLGGLKFWQCNEFWMNKNNVGLIMRNGKLEKFQSHPIFFPTCVMMVSPCKYITVRTSQCRIYPWFTIQKCRLFVNGGKKKMGSSESKLFISKCRAIEELKITHQIFRHLNNKICVIQE